MALQHRPAQEREKKRMIDRAALANRVRPESAMVANFIDKPRTEVTQIPTPFLERGEIEHVSTRGPDPPLSYYIGCAEDGFTGLLGNNAAGFFDFVRHAGIRLGDDNSRLQYVQTFLNVTTDFRTGFQILKSFDDIKLMNAAQPKESQRYQDLRQKYGAVIRPPVIKDSSVAQIWALQNRQLLQIMARVSPDGRIEVAQKVLEQEVPVNYTGR
jgi:hypothetical protein